MPADPSPAEAERVQIERAEVERAARELAYDDYLAALLAPRAHRADLITLAALFGELARIPLHVSDATLGEIRLQWWRDALSSNNRSGHPVADAALDVQSRRALPLAVIMAPVIEARAAELYAEPFPNAEAFDAYVSATEEAAFQLRASIMGLSGNADAQLPAAAARTLGLVKTCTRLPHLFAKGRYPLDAPRLGGADPYVGMDEAALRTAMSHLIADTATAWTALRPKLRRISPDLRSVLVPAALAEPYLRTIQKAGRDVLRDVTEPSQLERTTRLWLAARLGRF